jgi:hypothetical protein
MQNNSKVFTQNPVKDFIPMKPLLTKALPMNNSKAGKEKEFKIRLSTDSFGWGTGEHMAKCLIIKTEKQEHYFEEGHPVYNTLFRFAENYPNIFKEMKEIRVERMVGEKKYMIERMFRELHNTKGL